MAREDWRKAVKSLQESPENSLESMVALKYPIGNLEVQDVSRFTTLLLTTPILQKPDLVEMWSKVIHSICTVQAKAYHPRSYVSNDVANSLTDKMLCTLRNCTDPIVLCSGPEDEDTFPTELLYALSSLVRYSNRTSLFWEELVNVESGILIKMATLDIKMATPDIKMATPDIKMATPDIKMATPDIKMADKRLIKGIKIRRASLDYIASICQYVSLSVESMVKLIDCLLKLFDGSLSKLRVTKATPPDEQLLFLKLQVAILRVLHAILPQFDSFSVHILPSLLATLKVAVTTGLPRHHIPLMMRPLEPHPDVGYVDVGYQAASVAGPKQSKIRRKIHTDHPFPGHAFIRSDSGSGEGKDQNLSAESDSEVSDGEITSNSSQIRQAAAKIRLRALNCLSTIFQSLERQPTFSYGFSFLPHDTPTSNPPPSILTCLNQDYSHKCQSAAISVLMSILDNSKPFLAMASDSSSGSTRPFTSYSSKLGGVISELHRSLLDFISKEKRATLLTQAVKCLSILVSNTSYHKLTTSYIKDILLCLERLGSTSLINQTDVSIACLTCYGALISLPLPSEDLGKSSLPRREMEAWLKEDPNSRVWIFDHCVQLIMQQDTKQSLLMEAIQVLTALVKFYFPQIRPKWRELANVYFECLVDKQEPIQLHALKFLDEIGRTLATRQDMSDEISSIIEFWERLLSSQSPSLLQWLENTSLPLSCSHSCSVLATIGNTGMGHLSVETKKRVLPSLLSLSEDSNPSIKSSAIRTLGIFSKYSSQCFNDTFMLDVCDSITKGLVSKEPVAVRIQASWSIGNMTDSLIHEEGWKDKICISKYKSLSESVVVAMGDIEKVKVNAFRAAGNLLHVLTDEIYLMCENSVINMCSQLTASVNVGIMKGRWNACYACYNAFTNPSFLKNCSQPMLGMIGSLCSAVVTCKNFKVRTNAALALGGPSSYPSLEVLENIWSTVLKAIENSKDQPNFAEYQQTSSLRMQLCQVFCKLINAMENPSVTIRKSPPSEKALELLQKPIKEIIESSDGHSEKKELIDLTVKRLRESSDCLQEEKEPLNQEDILATLISSFDISTDDSPALFSADQCQSNMSPS